ncbi:HET-domain-containing protein, partial [Trematosphaeria pertusa]
ISPGSHISTDPASAACISQAKKWLDYCLRKHHASCGASHTQNLLPTRVIDVGSSTQNPHLYEPAPMETGRYAALSYCWGKSRTFTTTLSTLRDRKRGFQLEDLPKTCRDAVIVARALGIQYVWIDSCCIIQDSASDWEAEAAKMCSVYSNSLITFAGVDSPDSDTGLFVTEPDRRTVALSIMLSEYGRMGNLYARKMNSSYKFGFLHASSRPISDPSWNGILNSRGWTLQEVILSPRLLCFGSWELGWCCRAETACECDPLLRSDLLFRQSNLAETPMTMSNLTNQASQDERLYIWKKTVSQFTRRQLSYQTDRLPALAGLAGAMQERIGGRYVAGMWEKGIETMVVWYCERNTKKYGSYGSSGVQLPMEQAYAPSWSWASVQGMV